MEPVSDKGLSTRILALFIFTTSVLIFQGVYNIFSLDGVNNSITKVYDSVSQVSIVSSEISLPISELRQLSMGLVLAPNDALREELKVNVNQLQKKTDLQLRDGAGVVFASAEASRLYGNILSAWKGYSLAVDVTKAYVNEGVRIAAFISVTAHEKKMYDRVTLAVGAYNAYQVKISTETFKAAQENARLAFWAVVITTVVEVLILKAILAYVINLVRKYVAERRKHAEEVKSKRQVMEESIRLKKSLRERVEADEKLRHLRNYLSNIINSMPSVLIGVDLEGNVTQWNSGAVEETGISAEEALGQPLSKPFPRLSDEMQRVRDAIDSRQKQVVPQQQYEQNGVTRLSEMTIYPLATNGVEGAVIRLDDITEKNANELVLRRAQKMEAIGQLTGGIAHDFNNILGIVIGNLELLKLSIHENEKAQERIDSALKGAERGADITRKLLQFSRHKVKESEPVDINTILEGMDELVAKSLTVSIEVNTDLTEGVWPVNIDAGDFEDSILNLSLNAKDAMPDGGCLNIETSNKVLDQSYVSCNPGSKTGEYVMVSVGDSGIGMNDETKNSVFEPFFSTKKLGRGTGLGLSMVYSFVERSGGHINIYSEVGKGTTFNIFLPRAVVETPNVTSPKNSSSEMPGGTETILVVDDEDALLDIAKDYLNYLGYTVVTASNAEQAVKILEETDSIDMVFSDIIMPGDMDGYSLAGYIHEKYPEYKILLASGFAKKGGELIAGTNDYLTKLAEGRLHKPYNQAELAIAVRRVLDDDV
ncbi:MAG TPA: response regulator [Porticoccus sp.]|nr:response regulator [Porticoccus sp.]